MLDQAAITWVTIFKYRSQLLMLLLVLAALKNAGGAAIKRLHNKGYLI